MTKSVIVKAMPIASKWAAFHEQGGKWIGMGTRTVLEHRSTTAVLNHVEKDRESYLDYPKRKDNTNVSADGNEIVIGFVEDGKEWSRVRYERINN
jgi:hypothetical protein